MLYRTPANNIRFLSPLIKSRPLEKADGFSS